MSLDSGCLAVLRAGHAASETICTCLLQLLGAPVCAQEQSIGAMGSVADQQSSHIHLMPQYHVPSIQAHSLAVCREDPVILAWDICNEPRCKNGTTGTNGKLVVRSSSSLAVFVSLYLCQTDKCHSLVIGTQGLWSKEGDQRSGFVTKMNGSQQGDAPAHPHVLAVNY
jgi:hypothetical protein